MVLSRISIWFKTHDFNHLATKSTFYRKIGSLIFVTVKTTDIENFTSTLLWQSLIYKICFLLCRMSTNHSCVLYPTNATLLAVSAVYIKMPQVSLLQCSYSVNLVFVAWKHCVIGYLLYSYHTKEKYISFLNLHITCTFQFTCIS